MSKETITIKKLGRKQLPSKFKPGETFSITNVLDEKGRKMAGMGAWTEGWKVGDTLEVEIEEKKWTDKDGFEQTSMNLKNPNQKQFVPNQRTNPKVALYQIAAGLAPLFFKDKEKVTMEDIRKLVKALEKEIEGFSSSSTASTEVKKDTTPEVKIDDDSEDDDDFDEEDSDDSEEEPF